MAAKGGVLSSRIKGRWNWTGPGVGGGAALGFPVWKDTSKEQLLRGGNRGGRLGRGQFERSDVCLEKCPQDVSLPEPRTLAVAIAL